MRSILASALMLAACAAVPAHADIPGGMVTRSCIGPHCIWQFGPAPDMVGSTRIVRVPQPRSQKEIDAYEQRDAEWVRICEPVIVLDRYGMQRYTYGPACPNAVPVSDGRRP